MSLSVCPKCDQQFFFDSLLECDYCGYREQSVATIEELRGAFNELSIRNARLETEVILYEMLVGVEKAIEIRKQADQICSSSSTSKPAHNG